MFISWFKYLCAFWWRLAFSSAWSVIKKEYEMTSESNLFRGHLLIRVVLATSCSLWVKPCSSNLSYISRACGFIFDPQMVCHVVFVPFPLLHFPFFLTEIPCIFDRSDDHISSSLHPSPSVIRGVAQVTVPFDCKLHVTVSIDVITRPVSQKLEISFIPVAIPCWPTFQRLPANPKSQKKKSIELDTLVPTRVELATLALLAPRSNQLS
ncbi:hypothetical protein VTO42DRAFT_1998 [Malbranchea cinnamomea]